MEFLIPLAFVGLLGAMFRAASKRHNDMVRQGIMPGNYLGDGPTVIPLSLEQAGKNIRVRSMSASDLTPNTFKEKDRKVRNMEWDQEFQRLQREALFERTGLTPLELAEYVIIVKGFFTAVQKIENAAKSTSKHVDDGETITLHNISGKTLRESYINNCDCGSCVTLEMTQRASQLSRQGEHYEDLITLRANPDFQGIAYFHKNLKFDPVLDKQPLELITSFDKAFKNRKR